MEETILQTESLRLLRLETDRWVIYRFDGSASPAREDLLKVLEALARSVEEQTLPVCVVPENIESPNSRILATLIGLLVKSDGTDRRMALAGAGRAWVDMLDILGVRARFLLVDDVDELKSQE